jgi:hypothetical protein
MREVEVGAERAVQAAANGAASISSGDENESEDEGFESCAGSADGDSSDGEQSDGDYKESNKPISQKVQEFTRPGLTKDGRRRGNNTAGAFSLGVREMCMKAMTLDVSADTAAKMYRLNHQAFAAATGVPQLGETDLPPASFMADALMDARVATP